MCLLRPSLATVLRWLHNCGFRQTSHLNLRYHYLHSVILYFISRPALLVSPFPACPIIRIFLHPPLLVRSTYRCFCQMETSHITHTYKSFLVSYIKEASHNVGKWHGEIMWSKRKRKVDLWILTDFNGHCSAVIQLVTLLKLLTTPISCGDNM